MSTGRFAARVAAMTFVACFICALTGTGLPAPTPAAGQTAFANHKTGAATIPRQGVTARLSAAPQREHAKSPLSGGALGIPTLSTAAVLVARAGTRIAPLSSAHDRLRTAHLPRGPPRIPG